MDLKLMDECGMGARHGKLQLGTLHIGLTNKREVKSINFELPQEP